MGVFGNLWTQQLFFSMNSKSRATHTMKSPHSETISDQCCSCTKSIGICSLLIGNKEEDGSAWWGECHKALILKMQTWQWLVVYFRSHVNSPGLPGLILTSSLILTQGESWAYSQGSCTERMCLHSWDHGKSDKNKGGDGLRFFSKPATASNHF